MALDLVNAIRQCENEAAEIRRAAEARAKETIGAASEKGALLVEQREADAKREAEAILSRAAQEAKALADGVEASQQKETERLRQCAEANMASAAAFIIEELRRQ